MKQSLCIATVLIATTSLAGAEPSVEPARAYVAAGLSTGVGSAVDWLYGGSVIDGGYRLDETWWIHGQLGAIGRIGYGTTQSFELVRPEAYLYSAQIGAEARGCHSAALCGYAGGDVGYQIGTLRGVSRDGVVVAPRLGLDVGSRNLRFRPGVEMPMSRSAPMEEAPLMLGIGVTTTVAYQW